MQKDLNENIEILNKQIESQKTDYNLLVVEKNQEIEKLTTNTKNLVKSNEEKANDLKQQITQCESEIKKLESKKNRLQDEKDNLKNENKKLLSNKTILEELIQFNEKKASSEKSIFEQRIAEIMDQKENEKNKLQDGRIIYNNE